ARWTRTLVPAYIMPNVARTEWGLAMGDLRDGTEGHVSNLRVEGEEDGCAVVRVQFSTKHGRVYSTTMRTRCETVDRAEDILRTNSTPEASAAALRALDPRLCITMDGLTVAMDDRGKSKRWGDVTMGLGCRVEVLMDGRVVGRAAFAPSW